MKQDRAPSSSTRKALVFAFTTLSMLAMGSTVACGSLQAAAANDPVKCERDPNCPNKRRHNDCYVQCADDPACTDRCREVEVSAGISGQ